MAEAKSMKIGEFAVSATGEIDQAWMGEKLGEKVVSAKVKGFDEKMGGLSGDFNVIEVQLEGEKTITLILKVTNQGRNSVAVNLGTPREGLFLEEFSAKLQGVVPRCYHGWGDLKTGEKVVIMEKLENAVPAGVFFGPGNPNNWGNKDQLAELSEGNPSATETSREAFRLYAKLHARFWKDESLLAHEWLRAADWFKGNGSEGWEVAQKMASDAWVALKKSIDAGEAVHKWDDHTVKCIDASMAKIGWESYRKDLDARPWCIVHGDCHPHNAMWANQRTPAASLYLIDFEMVGVGSPVQELGQFLISHMEVAERRSCEKGLVEGYYKDLIDNLRENGRNDEADAFTFELCWEEYINGAAGRWLWFVPFMAKNYEGIGQFFIDQTQAFLEDHFPDPTKAPMPRV